MTDVQITLIRVLQDQAAWLAAPMLFFSFLGQPEFELMKELLMGISWALRGPEDCVSPSIPMGQPEVRACESSSFGLPSHSRGDLV